MARVTGLPQTGDRWFVRKVMLPSRADFLEPGEVVRDGGKGVQRMSLPNPWSEVAYFVRKYFTCEGRHSLLFGYHFKLLTHLRHQRLLNLPYFLLRSLQSMSHNVKHTNNPGASLSHHGLRKLLRVYALSRFSTWETFLRPVTPVTFSNRP